MEPLTYEAYLANPNLREKLMGDAHRERAEALYRYIVAPVVALFRRPTPKTSRVLQMRLA